MAPKLYYIEGSPPCRAVLLAAEAVGIELDLHYVDLLKDEQLKPEFVKINPLHTVPTLVDNGFILWESRSIMSYLVGKYAKNDSLYPKDLQTRALVDQKLYFDIGILYARFADYYYPVLFEGEKFDPKKFDKIQEAFKSFEILLEGQEYAVGNALTLADLSLVATVSSYDVLNFDIAAYKNVAKWYAKIQATAPGYEEANAKNVAVFKELAESLLNK